MIECWIQRANFESTERGEVDMHNAFQIFESVDWAHEWRYRYEIETSGQEFCDPGIGFVCSSGRILHVGAGEGETGYCHYHFTDRLRILGIPLWRSSKIVSILEIEWHDLNEYIQRFFANDHSWLVARAA